MIDIVTSKNVTNFGPTPDGESLIFAQHKLRYAALHTFGWQAPVFDHQEKLEYDDFDTPRTIYLIKRGPEGNLQGVVRINPTAHPYMLLKQDFNEMVGNKALPRDPKIWEGSRIAFDPKLNNETRRRGVAELSLAKAELTRHLGIKELVGMMPEYFWESVFVNSGWKVEYLGEAKVFEDDLSDKHQKGSRAAKYSISGEAITALRQKMGLGDRPILQFGDNKNSHILTIIQQETHHDR
jgi:N-acyl-L-homoserine lactone synthetase